MTPTPTAPEIGAGLMDLEPAMVERVAKAISKPLANMNGGCFKPDNGRSDRGDCADGDCYCARVSKHCARAALRAAAPIPLGCDPVVRERDALREDLFCMTAWKNRLADAFERTETRVSELLAWQAEARAALSQSIPIDGEG